MKAWITKYALTSGIYEVEAIPCSNGAIKVNPTKGGEITQYFHGNGKDWHLTESDARSCAEELREKKIASLKKQIVKLERMEF